MATETTQTKHTPGTLIYEPGEKGYPGSRHEPPIPDVPPFIIAEIEGMEDYIPICTLDSPIYRVEPPDPEDVFDDGIRDCGDIEANGRRIVAAWNACKGISTEALEQGVISEMREALRAIKKQWHPRGHSLSEFIDSCPGCIAAAAINKATKGA